MQLKEKDWVKVYVVKSCGEDFVNFFVKSQGDSENINKIYTSDDNYDIINCKVDEVGLELIRSFNRFCKIENKVT